MNKTRSVKAVFVVTITAITGCSTVSRQEAFLDTKSVIQERTGQKVIWNTNAEEDREITSLIGNKLQGEISLDDSIMIALLNNPSLQSKYEDLGVAQAELVQAGLLKNPLLDLSRRFPGSAAELDIFQDFLQILLIPLRRKISEAELEIVKLDVAHAILLQIAEVKKAFYDYQANLQQLEMRTKVVEASEASYSAAKEFKRAGNTANLNVQNEASALAKARADFSEVEMSLIESRERLNILMGIRSQNNTWTIANRLPSISQSEIDSTELETLALKQRFDLLAARKKITFIAVQYDLTRYLTVFPEISVGGHFEREPEGNETTGPSISVPLPIFDWGKAASLKGAAEMRRALKDYEAMEIHIASDVRSAFGRMVSARKRADYFFKEVLPAQTQALKETQLLYNGMFVGVFDLLQAKQAQINSGNDYTDSLLAYWLARTDLENAVGGFLPTTVTEAETQIDTKTDPAAPPPTENDHSKHQHHHMH